ncbi:MAG: ABC transporter permease [Clostridia bacterium]|nr:ABC transporter permease [Clostridia bacterium]
MNNSKTAAALKTMLAALICILAGLVIGFIVLLVLAYTGIAAKGEPFTMLDVIKTAYNDGFKQLLMGGFYLKPRAVRNEIALAAPLIMTGLSVGFAFKTGLFNIGAAGQYTVGALGALIFALIFKLPWYVCLLGAALFGAVWGAIPGFFKAYLNINEVITAIMFNWIGLYAVNTLTYMGGNSPMYNLKTTKTWPIAAKSEWSVIPDLGTTYFKKPATIAIFLAVAIALVLYVVLNKTTFGYELKACGLSKTSAKYAGINEKRNIILSMTISGALAGFGAGLYYLSGVAEWQPLVSTVLPSMGFDGISVALLASSNPIGIILSALFISHISTGGGMMNANLFPPEIADVISGVIIYLCAFLMLFRNALGRIFTRKNKGGTK